jgi:deazaflavin-dependent oxidoreductase (nitroreductase family)
MTKEAVTVRLADLPGHSTLQLTTTGRKSGKRHTVTVWFLIEQQTVYLVTLRLQRDWPRNIRKNGRVELDIAGKSFKGHAKRILEAKRLAHVKALLAQKYWAAWLASWFGMGPEGAFAVAIDG